MVAAAAPASDMAFDAAFALHYGRLVRVVARVLGDRGRAEELAVDVFVKWWRHPEARGDSAAGWLYRTAVRLAIDELRRNARRASYARLVGGLLGTPRTPEDLHAASEEHRRTRAVLRRLSRRDAALLLLRNDGVPYDELAAVLRLNPASIGTFISRAQRAFRKEYVRRYGEP